MSLESSMKNEWRSPSKGDPLSLADEQSSPSKKEDATHGQVCRTKSLCAAAPHHRGPPGHAPRQGPTARVGYGCWGPFGLEYPTKRSADKR